MTVVNGGNAIEGRRRVGFVRLRLTKAVFFVVRWVFLLA
jgi:hypothetical protein